MNYTFKFPTRQVGLDFSQQSQLKKKTVFYNRTNLFFKFKIEILTKKIPQKQT